MKSRFYYEGHYKTISSGIKEYLISIPQIVSGSSVNSPRAVGDAIQELVAHKFNVFLGDWCKEYSKDFARRAMADLAFTDSQDYYTVVDVKTHRDDTKFNMPNLTSVERLSRFYESKQNTFSVLMIKYSVESEEIIPLDVAFSPIEFLDWSCLTIGALGWGQIQIADSKYIKINDGYSRKKWMLELCDTMFEFYPKEIGKIKDRISRFYEVKHYWESQEDIWK